MRAPTQAETALYEVPRELLEMAREKRAGNARRAAAKQEQERAAMATPVVPPPDPESEMFVDESGEVARVRVPVESTTLQIGEREATPALHEEPARAAEPAAVIELPQANVPMRTWLLVAGLYVTVCYAGHMLLTLVR